MVMLGQFLRVPGNFEIFHDRLGGPGMAPTLPLLLLKDFRYQAEIWWDDAE